MMGNSDSSEMLEAAKQECVRLELLVEELRLELVSVRRVVWEKCAQIANDFETDRAEYRAMVRRYSPDYADGYDAAAIKIAAAIRGQSEEAEQ